MYIAEGTESGTNQSASLESENWVARESPNDRLYVLKNLKLNQAYSLATLERLFGMSKQEGLIGFLDSHAVLEIISPTQIKIIRLHGTEWEPAERVLDKPKEASVLERWRSQEINTVYRNKGDQARALLTFLNMLYPNRTFNSEQFKDSAEIDECILEISKRTYYTKGILLTYLVANGYIEISSTERLEDKNTSRAINNYRIIDKAEES